VEQHYERQLSFVTTRGSLAPFDDLPPAYRTELLDIMFGPLIIAAHAPRRRHARVLPLLLEAVTEEVFARDVLHWEFRVDPLTPYLNDLIIVQSGSCDIYARSDWLEAINQQNVRLEKQATLVRTSSLHEKPETQYGDGDGDGDDRELADIEFPDPIASKPPGSVIGFREFVTKKPFQCVIVPSIDVEMVSVLRIRRRVWDEVIGSVLPLDSLAYKQLERQIRKTVLPELAAVRAGKDTILGLRTVTEDPVEDQEPGVGAEKE